MSLRHARLLEYELVLKRKCQSQLPLSVLRSPLFTHRPTLDCESDNDIHLVDRQIIGVPDVVSESCLLIGKDTLTPTQVGNCTKITQRTFGTFDRHVNGLGTLTGANTLDVARIGINNGLLTDNATIVQDGYRRIHNEVVVQNATFADGIRADGSFGQHGGIIYNGNYGKD